METQSVSSGSNPIYLNFQGTARESSDSILMGVYNDEIEIYKNNTVVIEYFNLCDFPIVVNNEPPKILKLREIKTSINFKINTELEFLNNLKERESENELNAIDVLYNYLNPIIESRNKFKIETIVSFFIKQQFQLKLTIALLTITNPIKNMLSERNGLLNYARSLTSKIGLSFLETEKLLKGF